MLGWQKTFIYTVRKIYTHEKKTPQTSNTLQVQHLFPSPFFLDRALLSSPLLTSLPLLSPSLGAHDSPQLIGAKVCVRRCSFNFQR